jgi:hypothetical protein
MQGPRRDVDRLAVAILLLAALTPSGLLAWRFRDMPHVGIFHDDGIYLVSAQSLARNGEYRIASLPGEPYQTKYPPLYPLLLSVAWRLQPSFPANLPLAMLLTWSALPIYLLLSFVLFRELRFGRLASAVVCLIQGWNLHTTLVGIRLLSDLPFCALLLASLILAERASRTTSPRAPCLLAVLAGFLGGTAYLTRTAGLPLLISSPLCFLLRRQPGRAALFVMAMLPFVAGWNLWVSRHLSPQSDPLMLYYTDYLGYYRYNVTWQGLPSLLWRNLRGLALTLESLLTASMTVAFPRLDPLCLFLLCSLAGVGLLVARGLAGHYAVFGVLYVPLVLSWHYPPTPRFVLPLYPLLLAGLAIALARCFGALRSLARSPLVHERLAASVALSGLGGLLCLLLLWHVQMFATIVASFQAERSRFLAQRPTFEWIARSLPANANFLAYHDPGLYLLTGHHAAAMHVPPRLFEDPAAIEALFASEPEFAARHKLQYLLVTPEDFDRETAPDQLRTVVDRWLRDPSIVRLLHRSPDGSVYQFQPE